jgi:hypothetical protein
MSDFYPVGRGIDKDQEIEMLSGYEGWGMRDIPNPKPSSSMISCISEFQHICTLYEETWHADNNE